MRTTWTAAITWNSPPRSCAAGWRACRRTTPRTWCATAWTRVCGCTSSSAAIACRACGPVPRRRGCARPVRGGAQPPHRRRHAEGVMNRIHKYPRTHHLESSRLQPGDEDVDSVPFRVLRGRFLVVEEKLDGANAAV